MKLFILASFLFFSLSSYTINVSHNGLAVETRDFLRKYTATSVVRDIQYDIDTYSGIPEEVYNEQPAQGSFTMVGLPSFSEKDKEVRDNNLFLESRRQVLGTCVFESFENLYRQTLTRKGLTPPQSPILDIETSYGVYGATPWRDNGSYPISVYNVFSTTGLYRNYTPQIDTNSYNDVFTEWVNRADNLENIDDYVVVWDYDIKAKGYLLTDLFAEIQSCPECLARISIRNTNKVKWYNVEVPYVVSMQESDRSGGHSVAVNTAYGVFEYQGEPSLYIMESCGSTPYHIAKMSVLAVVITSWEVYAPSTDIAQYDPLSVESIRLGESGDTVTALQTFLEREGYFTYTGAKGYYGTITAEALSGWLYKKTGTVYSGGLWGNISRGVYNSL